jgi:hypothetical protein
LLQVCGVKPDVDAVLFRRMGSQLPRPAAPVFTPRRRSQRYVIPAVPSAPPPRVPTLFAPVVMSAPSKIEIGFASELYDRAKQIPTARVAEQLCTEGQGNKLKSQIQNDKKSMPHCSKTRQKKIDGEPRQDQRPQVTSHLRLRRNRRLKFKTRFHWKRLPRFNQCLCVAQTLSPYKDDFSKHLHIGLGRPSYLSSRFFIDAAAVPMTSMIRVVRAAYKTRT